MFPAAPQSGARSDCLMDTELTELDATSDFQSHRAHQLDPIASGHHTLA